MSQYFVVAYDPNDKVVVRGVYLIPVGMTIDEAENAVEAAYQRAGQDEDNTDAGVFLEEQGFASVTWTSVEI